MCVLLSSFGSAPSCYHSILHGSGDCTVFGGIHRKNRTRGLCCRPAEKCRYCRYVKPSPSLAAALGVGGQCLRCLRGPAPPDRTSAHSWPSHPTADRAADIPSCVPRLAAHGTRTGEGRSAVHVAATPGDDRRLRARALATSSDRWRAQTARVYAVTNISDRRPRQR